MNKEVLIKAAEALEKAASEITSSRSREDELLLENQKLKLMISAMLRASQAKKLSVAMSEKGIIPQKDVLQRAKEIMNLDDTGYSMLVSTVSGSSAEQKLDENPFEVGVPDAKGTKISGSDDILKQRTISAILKA